MNRQELQIIKTGKNILNILKKYSVDEKKTVIIITHNSSIAEAADKVIEIYDARVKRVTQNTNPKSIDEIEWQYYESNKQRYIKRSLTD